MSFADEVFATALRLVDLLERHRIPYLLMGGMVVPIWGVPRATFDVDLTLSVDGAGLARFLELVKADGFDVEPPFDRGFTDVLAGMRKLCVFRQGPLSQRIVVDVFLVTTP